MVAQIKPGNLGVTPLRAETREGEIYESRMQQQLGQSMMGLGADLTNIAGEMQENQDNADLSLGLSEAGQQYLDKGTFTRKELLDEGLEDQPNWTTGDLTDREDIDVQEVFPELMKAKYDSMIDEISAGGFIGAGRRKEWALERKQAAMDTYMKLDAQRNEYVLSKAIQKYDTTIRAAEAVGDYDLVASMIATHPDPTLDKNLALENLRIRQETENYNEVLLSGDPDEKLEMAEYLRGTGPHEYIGGFDRATRLKTAQQMEQAAQTQLRGMVAARSFEQDQAVADISLRVKNAQITYQELSQFAKEQMDLGIPLSKEWLASQYKALDTALKADEGKAIAAHTLALVKIGQGAMDLTNKDHTDAINADVNNSIANGNIEEAVRTVVATNYLPQVFTDITNGITNGVGDPATFELASQMYNMIRAEKPSALDGLDRDTDAALNNIARMHRTGMPLQDAIQAVVDAQKIDPDVRKRREARFNELNGGGQVEAELKDLFNDDEEFHGFWAAKVWGNTFGTIGTPNDNMQEDFATHVRHFMVTSPGAHLDMDAVYEQAYHETRKNYGVTNVNGTGPEVTVTPLERHLGVDSDVAKQVVDQIKIDQYNIPPEEVDNYVIKATPRTRFQVNPEYQLYKLLDGILPVAEQAHHNGQYGPALVVPNRDMANEVMKANMEKQYQQELEKAKARRTKAERMSGHIYAESLPTKLIQGDIGPGPLAQGQSAPPPHPEEAQLRSDEGYRNWVYPDPVKKDGHKYPTAGYGHLLSKEEQKKYPMGSVVPQWQIDEWLKEDIKEADQQARDLFKEHGVKPTGEQLKVVTNMVFQMGKAGVRDFKEMWKGYQKGDMAQVRREMANSDWHNLQTKSRAQRLIDRIN